MSNQALQATAKTGPRLSAEPLPRRKEYLPFVASTVFRRAGDLPVRFQAQQAPRRRRGSNRIQVSPEEDGTISETTC